MRWILAEWAEGAPERPTFRMCRPRPRPVRPLARGLLRRRRGPERWEKPHVSEMKFGALERYRVRGADGPPSLADIDPSDATALPFSKEELERATAADVAEIGRLQDVFSTPRRSTPCSSRCKARTRAAKAAPSARCSGRSIPSGSSRPAFRNRRSSSSRTTSCGAHPQGRAGGWNDRRLQPVAAMCPRQRSDQRLVRPRLRRCPGVAAVRRRWRPLLRKAWPLANA